MTKLFCLVSSCVQNADTDKARQFCLVCNYVHTADAV